MPLLVRIAKTSDKKTAGLIQQLADRGAVNTAKVEKIVRKIVTDVRRGGDRALTRYATKFDRLQKKQDLRVSQEEMEQAWNETAPEIRRALKLAARNIRRFATWQRPKEWSRLIAPGVKVGQTLRPLRAVGCYVPGGRYPLPSTMLMTVIPAQVAGVKEIVVVSPNPARETMAAAALLNVTNFYRIGGAQAVAALAYGTESVPRVDKIVGPGNLFVTAAKKLVSFDCGIDMLAGPTEAVVVSQQGKPALIAADLVAQSEHDPEALSIFITANDRLAFEVQKELAKQSANNSIAKTALKQNGVILVANSAEQAMEVANIIAPEHITVDSGELDSVRDAGSIFLGDFSPQTMGDYISGPNHVLPTGAVARHRGGLSVLDYLKVITVQELSSQGLARLGPWAVQLAEAEGLVAHAESVRIRSSLA